MPNEPQPSRLIAIAPEWLAGQVIRVRSTRMTIGRGQTDVYLDDPQVSRVHAALIAREEQPAVEDLGSRSGPQSTACASTRRRQAPRRHGQALLVEHRR